jgi:hypothetical protein
MTATPDKFSDAALQITKYSVFLYAGCLVAIPIAGKIEAASIAMSIVVSHLLAVALLAIPRVRRLFFGMQRLNMTRHIDTK